MCVCVCVCLCWCVSVCVYVLVCVFPLGVCLATPVPFPLPLCRPPPWVLPLPPPFPLLLFSFCTPLSVLVVALGGRFSFRPPPRLGLFRRGLGRGGSPRRNVSSCGLVGVVVSLSRRPLLPSSGLVASARPHARMGKTPICILPRANMPVFVSALGGGFVGAEMGKTGIDISPRNDMVFALFLFRWWPSVPLSLVPGLRGGGVVLRGCLSETPWNSFVVLPLY